MLLPTHIITDRHDSYPEPGQHDQPICREPLRLVKAEGLNGGFIRLFTRSCTGRPIQITVRVADLDGRATVTDDTGDTITLVHAHETAA